MKCQRTQALSQQLLGQVPLASMAMTYLRRLLNSIFPTMLCSATVAPPAETFTLPTLTIIVFVTCQQTQASSLHLPEQVIMASMATIYPQRQLNYRILARLLLVHQGMRLLPTLTIIAFVKCRRAHSLSQHLLE